MINLLPTEYATRLKFGRQNATLLKWVFAAIVACLGAALIVTSGLFYLSHQEKRYSASITQTNKTLEERQLEKTIKEAEEISNNVRMITKVLSQEIRFSKLLQDIGPIMPPGSVIGSLKVEKIDAAVDITVKSTSYTSASQAAANLGDPNNHLFDKVDVVSVNCTPAPKVYVCTSTIKAMFRKEAQAKYINIPQEST